MGVLRRALLWRAFVPALFLIAGCRPSPEPGVSFWHAMGGPLGDALDRIVQQFNESFPGEPILSVRMGNYGTLSQKIMGAVAANTPPVMGQVYESWTAELLEADRIVPFQEFIHLIPDSVLQDLFPVFVRDNQWDGRWITFPFNKSVPVFYYNRDLFERYGIDHFPRTWEEFREVARRLTIDEDGDGNPEIWGFAFNVDVWIFATILYQKGGRLIEGDRAVFDSPEGIAALQYLVDLVHKDRCAYIATGYRHQDDFAVGKVAMVWGTIVSYAFMKPKISFHLGIAPVPHDRDSVVIMAGTNVALFKGHPREKLERAVAFLRYFLRPEVQAEWSVRTGYLPLRRKALEQPAMEAFLAEIPGFDRAIRQIEYADFEPRDPVWFTGRRILNTEGLEPALRGFLSPEESLHRAAMLINQEIRRRKALQRMEAH